MDQGLVDTLRTLRDIKGIQGSFVVRSESGHIVGRDLPTVIDDAVLAQVGPRIDRLLSVVESDTPTESIAMRFGDQRLDIRRIGLAHLCVLAEASISQPALRMAIKLVCRKLEGYNYSVPPEEPPLAAAESSGGAEKPTRYFNFRGLRIAE